MTDKKEETEDSSFQFNFNDTVLVSMEKAEWGDAVWLGYVLGEEVVVHRPLNETAANQSAGWALVAVLLGERVKTLEERIALLEDKIE